MFSLITAFFTTLGEGCKTLTSYKERQSETDVIKTKKSKTKAVEYAEKIIFHIDKNYEVSTDKRYQKLKKIFFRYN